MQHLTGKTAIITGASKGIGKACAEVFATHGAQLTLIARSKDKLDDLINTLPNPDLHQAFSVDLLDDDLAATLEQTLGKKSDFDILINNTGGPAGGPIHSAQATQFLSAFQQHLIANHALAQFVLPHMRTQQWGRIINIISTSVKQPIKGLGVSNTIRGAVANWAKTLAGEVGEFNITVNNVLPGFTDTDRLTEIFGSKADKTGLSLDDIIANAKQSVPLKRFADPRETAQAVAFLASNAAAYINGINLPVDGGRTLSL